MTVDDLAAEIRRVDGNHFLGAGALAEALMPFLRAALTQPAAVEDGELRRLMAEATPGPWFMKVNAIDPEMSPDICANIPGARNALTVAGCMPADAALIVAAVNALPGLMAERDRMKEAAKTALGCLDDPTGGTHVEDMRKASEALRAALGEQP